MTSELSLSDIAQIKLGYKKHKTNYFLPYVFLFPPTSRVETSVLPPRPPYFFVENIVYAYTEFEWKSLALLGGRESTDELQKTLELKHPSWPNI